LLVKSLVSTKNTKFQEKSVRWETRFSIRTGQKDITGLEIASRCAKARKNDVVSQVTTSNTESHNYSYPKLGWILDKPIEINNSLT
jgi:hypothetical protein